MKTAAAAAGSARPTSKEGRGDHLRDDGWKQTGDEFKVPDTPGLETRISLPHNGIKDGDCRTVSARPSGMSVDTSDTPSADPQISAARFHIGSGPAQLLCITTAGAVRNEGSVTTGDTAVFTATSLPAPVGPGGLASVMATPMLSATALRPSLEATQYSIATAPLTPSRVLSADGSYTPYDSCVRFHSPMQKLPARGSEPTTTALAAFRLLGGSATNQRALSGGGGGSQDGGCSHSDPQSPRMAELSRRSYDITETSALQSEMGQLLMRTVDRLLTLREDGLKRQVFQVFTRCLYDGRELEWGEYCRSTEQYWMEKTKAREAELVADLAEQEFELQQVRDELISVIRSQEAAVAEAAGVSCKSQSAGTCGGGLGPIAAHERPSCAMMRASLPTTIVTGRNSCSSVNAATFVQKPPPIVAWQAVKMGLEIRPDKPVFFKVFAATGRTKTPAEEAAEPHNIPLESAVRLCSQAAAIQRIVDIVATKERCYSAKQLLCRYFSRWACNVLPPGKRWSEGFMPERCKQLIANEKKAAGTRLLVSDLTQLLRRHKRECFRILQRNSDHACATESAAQAMSTQISTTAPFVSAYRGRLPQVLEGPKFLHPLQGALSITSSTSQLGASPSNSQLRLSQLSPQQQARQSQRVLRPMVAAAVSVYVPSTKPSSSTRPSGAAIQSSSAAGSGILPATISTVAAVRSTVATPASVLDSTSDPNCQRRWPTPPISVSPVTWTVSRLSSCSGIRAKSQGSQTPTDTASTNVSGALTGSAASAAIQSSRASSKQLPQPAAARQSSPLVFPRVVPAPVALSATSRCTPITTFCYDTTSGRTGITDIGASSGSVCPTAADSPRQATLVAFATDRFSPPPSPRAVPVQPGLELWSGQHHTIINNGWRFPYTTRAAAYPRVAVEHIGSVVPQPVFGAGSEGGSPSHCSTHAAAVSVNNVSTTHDMATIAAADGLVSFATASALPIGTILQQQPQVHINVGPRGIRESRSHSPVMLPLRQTFMPATRRF